MTGETRRKLLHMAMIVWALLLRWLETTGALVFAGAALVFNLVALPRLARSVYREEGEARALAGGIAIYPITVGLLVLFFGRRMFVVAGAWAILALGDGMATIVGRRFGRLKLPWNAEKSWAGTAAFLVAGAAGALALMAWVGKPDGWTSWYTTGQLALMAILAALACALLESLPVGLNDNLYVPLAGGLALFAMSELTWVRLADPLRLWPVAGALLVNGLIAAAAYRARSVNVSGLVAGFVLGSTILIWGGWEAYLVLIAFFVLASAGTRLGYGRKAARGLAQEEGGARGARHALANTGMAAILAVLAASSAPPLRGLYLLALVAAFATAAADTISSELGQLCGRVPVLLPSFKTVPPGTEGAVSLEGTAFGVAASLLVALVARATGLTSWTGVLLVVIAAFAGNLLESWAGGRADKLGVTNNEVLNFLNTAAGALIALGLGRLFLV